MAEIKWWRRPWVVPLAFVAVAFVTFSLPPYLTGGSRVPLTSGLSWYYPLLVAHVSFASVAMLTCVLQVWPWFRQPYPRVHRITGRVYVFAGVLPAGLAGWVLGSVTPFGPVAMASSLVMPPLWLAFTVVGYRMARQKRFLDHRKWMLRSFVLTMSIITNRVWSVIAYLALAPQLDTTFHGDGTLLSYSVAGIATWLGWTVPLLVLQWRFDRADAAKRFKRPVTV